MKKPLFERLMVGGRGLARFFTDDLLTLPSSDDAPKGGEGEC